MRHHFVAFIAVLFAAAVPAMALSQSSKNKKEPEWQAYESELMNYKTHFPGKPTEKTKKPNSKAGDLIVNTASLESKDLIYAVTATQYPEKIKEADSKQLFTAAKDALSANGGKIVTDEAVSITGPNDTKRDGRDVTVEYGKLRIRTRLLLIDSILYQVSVTGTEKALANPLAGKFLSSFELTK